LSRRKKVTHSVIDKKSLFLLCSIAVLLFLADNSFFVTPAVASSLRSNLPVPKMILTSPNTQLDDGYGGSVAIGSNVIAIGAEGANVSEAPYAGVVYVYNLKTDAPTYTLKSPEPQRYGGFGDVVVISGSLLVVSAPFENSSGYQAAGNVYLINVTTGALITSLSSLHPQADGFFGFSIAASGSTVIVGAPYENSSGYQDAGNTYVFNLTSGIMKSLVNPDPSSYSIFGSSVGVSGNIVLVGTPRTSKDIPGGIVYVFNVTTGSLIRTLESPNEQREGGFGDSIAMSGNLAAIDADGEESGGFSGAGNVYVFNTTTGALTSTISSPKPQRNLSFGTALSISGSLLVVGNPRGDKTAGLAYAFNATNGHYTNKFTSSNPVESGYFGFSTATNGRTIVIGAPYENPNMSGNVYVFY
jgi:hypothetical protein